MAETLTISSIKMDEATQSRVLIDDDTVQSYAEDLRNGAIFPPITVFHDGECFYLADGFHRVEAMSQVGTDVVQADVREGTKRDALLYSVGANATNGLRRTNADKRKSVRMLLQDPEWASWSDVQIGNACGVSDKTVAKYRMSASSEIPKIANSSTRTVSRKGKTYKQNTAKIGRTPAPPPPKTSDPAPYSPNPGSDTSADFCSYRALAYLQKIDNADPDRLNKLKWVKTWIEKQLDAAQSAGDPGLDSQLAMSAH